MDNLEVYNKKNQNKSSLSIRKDTCLIEKNNINFSLYKSEIGELAYRNWKKDVACGVVILDTQNWILKGISKKKESSFIILNSFEVVLFKLSSEMDIEDEELLVTKESVSNIRSTFNIDEVIFLNNKLFWIEKYYQLTNNNIKFLRDKYLELLIFEQLNSGPLFNLIQKKEVKVN
ncbi:hypothetical protein ACFVR2_06290 [Gottfriedia sp. NPDC057991]|uniref:hypothetical protein n=1 Tax=Gottfriedia sp. NPDC057991 TaxID=3346298 RepID=UPI0036D773CE